MKPCVIEDRLTNRGHRTGTPEPSRPVPHSRLKRYQCPFLGVTDIKDALEARYTKRAGNRIIIPVGISELDVPRLTATFALVNHGPPQLNPPPGPNLAGVKEDICGAVPWIVIVHILP